MAILRLRQADGTWAEIPALVGPQGPKGDKGSDASVTAANIADALGYTPANPSSVPSKTENWTFTLTDGSAVTKAVYVG